MKSGEEDDDAAAIGARIGQRLVAAKNSAEQPAVAIRLLVQAVVAQHPAVKLPELAGDTEVRNWLRDRAIGEGQLRHALTEARKALRAKREGRIAKRQPRARSKAAATVAGPAADVVTSRIPNRPLADL